MNQRLLILTGSVVGVHLFFVFFNFKNEKHSPSPKKSIVVHTFTPRPKPKIKTNKKTEKTQTAITSKKTELLKELTDSLKKFETPTPLKQESVLTLPKNIQALQIDETEQIENPDYFILLGETLKEELELPEHGDVKLELTVLSTGRVSKVRVLAAASKINRRYLELNLPRRILPPFSEDLKNEREHTFTLTFCNEK